MIVLNVRLASMGCGALTWREQCADHVSPHCQAPNLIGMRSGLSKILQQMKFSVWDSRVPKTVHWIALLQRTHRFAHRRMSRSMQEVVSQLQFHLWIRCLWLILMLTQIDEVLGN